MSEEDPREAMTPVDPLTRARYYGSSNPSCTGGLGCCDPHGDCPQCGCAGKIERLRQFIRTWSHDGHLQTFEDRERFRKRAADILGDAAVQLTLSPPVVNSPADEAEVRDRAHGAPRQADPDAPGRGETGASSGSEARPVIATEHREANPKLRMIEPFCGRGDVRAAVEFSKLGGSGCVIIEHGTPDNEEAEVILSAREAYDLMLWLECALEAPTGDLEKIQWKAGLPYWDGALANYDRLVALLGPRDETIRRLTRERDQWKKRHDRERSAHATNLKVQQKCEAEIERLRRELRLAESARDYANDMLDKARRPVETAAPPPADGLIELLQHLDPGVCDCQPCPECDKMPAECSGTECAQTCQCSECDHCRIKMAIDGLRAWGETSADLWKKQADHASEREMTALRQLARIPDLLEALQQIAVLPAHRDERQRGMSWVGLAERNCKIARDALDAYGASSETSVEQAMREFDDGTGPLSPPVGKP